MKNKSKFFIYILIILILISGSALLREIVDNIKIKNEISTLEKQAKTLEEDNQNLKSLIEYLNSSDYKELVAREHLNLKKPGETAVALPKINNQTEEQVLGEQKNNNSSNPEKWWKYFFGNKF